MMTKIDRVLVSIDWEINYPDYLLQALSTNISDHAPLHLSTLALFCPKRRFCFELFWLKLEGFDQAVRGAWVYDEAIVWPIQAWGKRKSGNIKVHMAVANYVIYRFDQVMEVRALTMEEQWLRRMLKLFLLGLASLERTIAWQRSRIRWIRIGDTNPKLFQAVANVRWSKNYIPHIKHNNEIIREPRED